MDSNISDLKIKLFYLATFISILEHGVNFLTETNGHIFIVDAITLVLITLLLGVYLRKMISTQLANSILLYAVFVNVLISVGYNINSVDIEGLLFLSAMTFLILVLYAGFTLNNKHLLVLGITYILFYCFVAIYSKSDLVKSNSVLVFIIIIGYLYGINFIVKLLNRYNAYQIELIDNLKKRNILLRKQGTELNNLNNTKDKLFSIIGHDLKSPASSIMGFADLISMKAESSGSDSIKEFSKHIYISANKLNTLLEQLLHWARIQNGKVRVNIEEVNIDD